MSERDYVIAKALSRAARSLALKEARMRREFLRSEGGYVRTADLRNVVKNPTLRGGKVVEGKPR